MSIHSCFLKNSAGITEAGSKVVGFSSLSKCPSEPSSIREISQFRYQYQNYRSKEMKKSHQHPSVHVKRGKYNKLRVRKRLLFDFNLFICSLSITSSAQLTLLLGFLTFSFFFLSESPPFKVKIKVSGFCSCC